MCCVVAAAECVSVITHSLLTLQAAEDDQQASNKPTSYAQSVLIQLWIIMKDNNIQLKIKMCFHMIIKLKVCVLREMIVL